MIWPTGSTTAFFTDQHQMGLKHTAVDALKAEGITSVEDLGSFEDDLWTTVVNNLKHPATVLNPGPNNTTIESRGVVINIGALSLSILFDGW